MNSVSEQIGFVGDVWIHKLPDGPVKCLTESPCTAGDSIKYYLIHIATLFTSSIYNPLHVLKLLSYIYDRDHDITTST